MSMLPGPEKDGIDREHQGSPHSQSQEAVPSLTTWKVPELRVRFLGLQRSSDVTALEGRVIGVPRASRRSSSD